MPAQQRYSGAVRRSKSNGDVHASRFSQTSLRTSTTKVAPRRNTVQSAPQKPLPAYPAAAAQSIVDGVDVNAVLASDWGIDSSADGLSVSLSELLDCVFELQSNGFFR